MSVLRSPITGETTFVEGSAPRTGKLAYFNDSIGRWFLADPILDLLGGLPQGMITDKPTYSAEQMKAGWWIVRSKIWMQGMKGLDPVCVVNQAHHDSLMRRTEDIPPYTLVSFDAAIAEAERLTFEDKCVRTLLNIELAWRRRDDFVVSDYQFGIQVDGKKTLDLRFRTAAKENGMAYGCDEKEAALVMQSLRDRGWIQIGWNGSDPKGWYPGAAGAIEIDRHRNRNVNLNQAFFVRPWDPERDAFFSDVRAGVQEATGIVIEAVWDKPHNEKIDERILRLIRESAAIVVEVAPTKFNVGLEVGYGLALGKPIVAIRNDPEGNLPLPFDIATLHCHAYKEEDKDALIERLSEKLQVAVATAKLMSQ